MIGGKEYDKVKSKHKTQLNIPTKSIDQSILILITVRIQSPKSISYSCHVLCTTLLLEYATMSHVFNNTPTCMTWNLATCIPTNFPCFSSLCFCSVLIFFFLFEILCLLFIQVSISMAFSLRTKTFTFIEGEAPTTQWWNEIDDSDQLQRGIYYTLCAAYATVSFIALVCLFLVFSSKILDQSLYYFGFHFSNLCISLW